MRIISKFYDYYDIGLGLGYDSHVTYIRSSREIDLSKELDPRDTITKNFFAKIRPLARNWSSLIVSEYTIIGFCGKFYPLVIARKDGEDIFCYSLEELAQVIEIPKWSGYKEFYDTVKALKNDELFITNQSPIVVVRSLGGKKVKVIWNDFLKPYNFVRVIDPYQAFQKIEMFLGNMAAPEKPIPKRTDIEKIQSHGFDTKMGFRKGKEQ